MPVGKKGSPGLMWICPDMGSTVPLPETLLAHSAPPPGDPLAGTGPPCPFHQGTLLQALAHPVPPPGTLLQALVTIFIRSLND